jgi:hypothetical protein
MRLMRGRFTVRRLMIVVASVALIIFGEQTRLRYLEYRTKYECYKVDVWVMRASAEDPQIELCGYMRLDEKDVARLRLGQVEKSLRYARYFEALRDKYAAAMRRPWLPVEPDPPKPEDY